MGASLHLCEAESAGLRDVMAFAKAYIPPCLTFQGASSFALYGSRIVSVYHSASAAVRIRSQTHPPLQQHPAAKFSQDHMLRCGLGLRTILTSCRVCCTASLNFRMASTLPPTIRHGILNVPGASYESKMTVERLLQDDRDTYHCFFGKVGLHNHLSHQ